MTTSPSDESSGRSWRQMAVNAAGLAIYGGLSLTFAAVTGVAAFKFAENYLDGELNDQAGTVAVIGAVGALAAGRRALQGSGLMSAESQEERRPHVFGG